MKQDYVKPETLIVQLRFKKATLRPIAASGQEGGQLSRGLDLMDEDNTSSSPSWGNWGK